MKDKLLSLFFWSLLTSSFLFSEEAKESKAAYTPWYTGTIEATACENASPGQLVIQPFYNIVYRYGNYNSSWKNIPLEHKQIVLIPQLFLEWGITDRLDFNIEPTMVTTFQNGMSETLFTDLYTALGIQILRDIPNSYVPSLRILFEITWPTGKFDKGLIDRLSLDFSGTGAYQVGTVIAIGKAFYDFPNHPFRFNFNFGISGSSDADIRGISVYGGDEDTVGTMNPGAKVFTYFTGEFSVTQRFALAFESYFQYNARNRFVGINEIIPFQEAEQMQFLFIPELEYSWAANFGIVAGVGWQFLGYNQSAFTGLTVSLVYTY